jgi:diguanylate cyclase (GGDEF)-like protein
MYKIVLMDREEEDQVVQAFDADADEFVVKPFNPRILLARVRVGERMVRMRERVERSERARTKQVAELGLLSRKLRSAALTDALTDLPNRRYAMNRLKQEWEGSVRSGRPISVTMIDIDHFKRVNDRYGHDAGDEVLRKTAGLLRDETRQSDVLCRLGGEEFLCIHVATELVSAANSAERLRAAVEDHVIEVGEFNQNVTISLGVAERTSGMLTFDDLLKLADEHLYQAKDAGRNRVVAKGGPPPRALSA